MKTCIDKTCEAVLCEECNDLKPSMCGDRGLQFPKDACDVITFEGVEDVETKQGLCVDLTEGVHAYDGDGTEISYTVEPSEIGCCDVGEHEVTYTAVGKGNKMLPSFCLGKPMLTTADCGLMTKVVTRVITILQSLPPKIIGAVRTVIPVGATFDPLEGVSGIDDNGKETEVTYEGRYDETTGMVDIASVESDIDQNAKHLYVELEPIQDLHGYDKPWAGGAGKNKLHFESGAHTVNGVTFTQTEDNSVIVNGTATSSIIYNLKPYSENERYLLLSELFDIMPNTDYILTGCPSGGGFPSYRLQLLVRGSGAEPSDDGDGSSRFSFSESDISSKLYRLTIRIASGTVCNNLVFKPMIRLATEADATFAPYSNICPISGRTECVISVSGVNVWDEEWEVYNNSYIVSKNYIPVVGGETYYWNCSAQPSNGLRYYDADKNLIKTDYSTPSTKLIVMPSNCRYIIFRLSSSYGTTYNHDISINYPSTDHDYHAHDGDTYTTDLGRTVYGGTLDVVSGELVVDRAMRTFDGSRDEAWSFREGANRNRVVLPDVDERTGSYNTDILGNYITATDDADSNPQVWKANINALGNLLVGIPSSIGNISKWVEYLSQNPLQIAYKLASPQTIRLGKQTIALLQGDNNVWSEDGKVEVVYTKPISGETQFDTEGVYTIYYHTEDECGNETTVKRYLIVGECNTEQAEPVLCKGKMCCATLDCSENYLVVCNGTVCDGRVACSSSEPTICNGKICSAKLSCTQTEITPIEV